MCLFTLHTNTHTHTHSPSLHLSFRPFSSVYVEMCAMVLVVVCVYVYANSNDICSSERRLKKAKLHTKSERNKRIHDWTTEQKIWTKPFNNNWAAAATRITNSTNLKTTHTHTHKSKFERPICVLYALNLAYCIHWLSLIHSLVLDSIANLLVVCCVLLLLMLMFLFFSLLRSDLSILSPIQMLTFTQQFIINYTALSCWFFLCFTSLDKRITIIVAKFFWINSQTLTHNILFCSNCMNIFNYHTWALAFNSLIRSFSLLVLLSLCVFVCEFVEIRLSPMRTNQEKKKNVLREKCVNCVFMKCQQRL